ncbi:hypothetical protein MJK70_18705 [Klebsiella pneumoniae]|nr:hypothetical protein MJK70_18705 [Klebsiella pneumoniae]
MNQNLLVTKRDGSTERIQSRQNPSRVLDWAAEGRCITFRFPEGRAALHTFSLLGQVSRPLTSHETIIKAAAGLISRDAPDYQYLARASGDLPPA